MINYQRFVMYFREIERDFNEAGLKNINIHMITKKRLDFYKRVGMDTEDKISQYEHKTTKNLMADLNLTLEFLHHFIHVLFRPHTFHHLHHFLSLSILF